MGLIFTASSHKDKQRWPFRETRVETSDPQWCIVSVCLTEPNSKQSKIINL